MSTIRERPKGLTPAPLKPRLAANISNSKATPPPRLTVRPQDSSTPPASTIPPRRPLVDTTPGNARHSPAASATTATKNVNTSTPTNRPLLRAARPTSTASPPSTQSTTNSRSGTPTITPRTSSTTNKTLRQAPSNRTLRKAPSSYFTPREIRSRPASPVRPPLGQKTSSFVYANGEVEEESPRSQRDSDVQSVRSQQIGPSAAISRSSTVQKENVQDSARSSVASPILSPSATPSLIQQNTQFPNPGSIRNAAPQATELAARLDKLRTLDRRPASPTVQTNPGSVNHLQPAEKSSSPFHNGATTISPTECEENIGTLDSTPHVARTMISVDFPSKLPSPARRRSIATERQEPASFSPSHRKIQSVSAAAPAPPLLSRIDTGIAEYQGSETTTTNSSLPSRLPRMSLDAGRPAAVDGVVDGADETSDQNESEASTANVKIGAARHERKLLDLEISNSSLLAINRSLEREVLKQKSELRRLRRGTRGGIRASWLSEMSIDEDMPSELGMSSPTDSEVVDQSTVYDIDTPSKVYGQTAQSSTDTRTNLDLTKHKELLIDSQKMNLSLQRCLGMTEQLLKDANKALDYQPRVSSKMDIHEELETEEEATTSRLADEYSMEAWDWTSASNRDQAQPRPPSERRETATTDKDSGVELNDVAHLSQSKGDQTLAELRDEAI